MLNLLSSYSATTIAIIIFMVLVAFKELIELLKYFYNILKKHFGKEEEEKKNEDKILEQLNELKKDFDEHKKEHQEIKSDIQEIKEELVDNKNSIKRLVTSDRNDIKSWLVEKHHFFTKQGWVDDFSMDTVNRRFSDYVEEGGNSYAESLVSALRDLPNQPPQ